VSEEKVFGSIWFDLVRFGSVCCGLANRQRTEKKRGEKKSKTTDSAGKLRIAADGKTKQKFGKQKAEIGKSVQSLTLIPISLRLPFPDAPWNQLFEG